MLHHHDVGSNIVGTCFKHLKQIQVHDGRVHMFVFGTGLCALLLWRMEGSFSFTKSARKIHTALFFRINVMIVNFKHNLYNLPSIPIVQRLSFWALQGGSRYKWRDMGPPTSRVIKTPVIHV